MRSMKKIILTTFIISFCLFVVFFSFYQPVFALTSNVVEQTIKTTEMTGQSGFGEDSSNGARLLANISWYVQVLLTFSGIVVVFLITYAGFLWMTAGGNKEQIVKAKSRLINATIGLIIVLSAYAITHYVVEFVVGRSMVDGYTENTDIRDECYDSGGWFGTGNEGCPDLEDEKQRVFEECKNRQGERCVIGRDTECWDSSGKSCFDREWGPGS